MNDTTEQRPACKYDWSDAMVEQRRLKAARITLQALATHADSKTGRGAYPGRELLAKRVGVHPNTIDRHLQMGVDAGLIERTSKGSTDARRDRADEYRLIVPLALTTHTPGCDWSGWLAETDQSQFPSRPLTISDRPLTISEPTTHQSCGDPTGSNRLSTTGSKPPPPEPDAEPETAAASGVAESSTCAPSSREEEERSSRGREGVKGVSTPRFGITPYLARRGGFTSTEEAERFFADMPRYRSPAGFLSSDFDREDFAEQVEEWRADQQKQELAEAEARYGPVWERYMTLSGWGVPRWDSDRVDRVTALGEALARGATWDQIQDALSAVNTSLPPRERPALTAMLASLGVVAEPATEDPPLPESGKADAREAQMAEWHVELARMAEPAAAGDF